MYTEDVIIVNHLSNYSQYIIFGLLVGILCKLIIDNIIICGNILSLFDVFMCYWTKSQVNSYEKVHMSLELLLLTNSIDTYWFWDRPFRFFEIYIIL